MTTVNALTDALTLPQIRLLRDAAAFGNALENIGLRQRAAYGQVVRRLGDLGLLTRSPPYRSTELGVDALGAIDYDAARRLREGHFVEIHETDARSNSWIWLAVGPEATGGTVVATGGDRGGALDRVVGRHVAFPADGCRPHATAAHIRANRDPARGDVLRLDAGKRTLAFRISRIERITVARARLLGLQSLANRHVRPAAIERKT